MQDFLHSANKRLLKPWILIFSDIFNQKKSYLYVCMYVFIFNRKKDLTCNDHCLPLGGRAHLNPLGKGVKPRKILKYIYSNPEVKFTDSVLCGLLSGERHRPDSVGAVGKTLPEGGRAAMEARRFKLSELCSISRSWEVPSPSTQGSASG